jgi:hypothetical protein
MPRENYLYNFCYHLMEAIMSNAGIVLNDGIGSDGAITFFDASPNDGTIYRRI